MEKGSNAGTRTDLYEQLARIGKVVVHPKRIELLDLLCQAERSVEALAAATGLKLSTASAHLQIMRQARLVETRRDGTRVYYRAGGEEVCRFVTALGDIGRARLAEVDQILRSIAAGSSGSGSGGEAAERVTRAELLERARAGAVVVLDVRPAEEYAAGHIPGAVSLPLEHLEARLDELDPEIEVVAYCRGPLCLLAPEAVATLRARGMQARCLEDGLPEWRGAGLPVAAGVAAPHASSGRSERRRGGPAIRVKTSTSKTEGSPR
ncbi:MAG: ArsR/SmtB family transcription factor [Acidimicrobiales bacterium]